MNLATEVIYRVFIIFMILLIAIPIFILSNTYLQKFITKKEKKSYLIHKIIKRKKLKKMLILIDDQSQLKKYILIKNENSNLLKNGTRIDIEFNHLLFEKCISKILYKNKILIEPKGCKKIYSID